MTGPLSAASFATTLKFEHLLTFYVLIIHHQNRVRLPTLSGLSVLFITCSGMSYSS